MTDISVKHVWRDALQTLPQMKTAERVTAKTLTVKYGVSIDDFSDRDKNGEVRRCNDIFISQNCTNIWPYLGCVIIEIEAKLQPLPINKTGNYYRQTNCFAKQILSPLYLDCKATNKINFGFQTKISAFCNNVS